MLSSVAKSLKHFTRGGQVALHSVRMFNQIVSKLFLFLVLIFISLTGYIWNKTVVSYDKHLTWVWVQSAFHTSVFNGSNLIEVRERDGTKKQVSAAVISQNPIVNQAVLRAKSSIIPAAIFSLLSCVTLGLFFCYWLLGRGKKHLKNEHHRGAKRAEVSEVNAQIKKENKKLGVKIADIHIPFQNETHGFMLAGTTGSGKSTAMHGIMRQVRKRKERAIIYDIEGDFSSTYYREGKDYIANPLDARCVAWSQWLECDNLAHYDAITNSLMPNFMGGKDPFWLYAARTLYSVTSFQLREQNKHSFENLTRILFSKDLKELANVVKGTAAETLTSADIEKTALCIKVTILTFCKSLLYLPDDSKANFSFKKWMESDDQDSWLFICSNQDMKEAVNPIMTVWVDLAFHSLLRLSRDLDRRVWFFLDELDSLNQLPRLLEIAERGRKKGSCLVTGFQDVNQVVEKYGREQAQTLTSLLNNKVCFRNPDPTSANWLSKGFGVAEIMETKEGISYGAHEMRDGVNLSHNKREERVVLESEILQASSLDAFVQCDGYPVTKVTFDKYSPPQKAPAFVPRDLGNLAHQVGEIDTEVRTLQTRIMEIEKNEDPKEKRKSKVSGSNKSNNGNGEKTSVTSAEVAPY